MKALPIPETEQIQAMLSGSIRDLLTGYIENPPQYDFRKFLTVNRQTLIDFLLNNPVKAKTYFENKRQIQTTHDVEKIWEENGEYFIASMNHGNARSIRQFRSLAEAVAEHVLVSYGMY